MATALALIVRKAGSPLMGVEGKSVKYGNQKNAFKPCIVSARKI